MRYYTTTELLALVWIASRSPMHTQVMFWAMLMQGNTRVASFVQQEVELQKPSAVVFDIKTGRAA